jgi:hypothetical protein
MKKYSKPDQVSLAKAAADWAERVLPLFESISPGDRRPRTAIQEGRKWAKTLEFKMSVIRGASLAAHDAARDVNSDEAACAAAHAAGQAVATAHVPQHAFGAAYYALKAVAAADPMMDETRLIKERGWQSRRLPQHLRHELLKRMMIGRSREGISIKLHKGRGF